MLHFHQLLYALLCIKFRSSRASLWLDNKFIRLALKKSSLKADLKNIFLSFKPTIFETTPSRSKAITCTSAVLVWLHVPNTWSVPAAGVPTQINTFEDKKGSCPCSLIRGTHAADCSIPFKNFAGIRLCLLGKPTTSIKILHPTQTCCNG